MYGAILGDIIGSPFEFDRGDKTKDFELFTDGCDFTDDSVMTLAVAAALMEAGPDASEEYIKETLIYSMQEWGRDYPHAGYGGGFRRWLKSSNPKPYNSWGNGSAMRVSAAGWLYPTLERTREVARYTAEVTHNHPEGVKGAEATASCIFLARNGATKVRLLLLLYMEDNMQIFVDADACPVVGIVENVAEKYNIPVTLLCDTNHVLTSEYSEVIVVGAGADAVDYKLISICHRGDIVVSQDYGVAAMALGKGAYAIHQSGKWYTDDNIDQMLMERHLNKKARRSSYKNHVKGTRKRTEEDDIRFAQSFERMVMKSLQETKR